MHPKSETRRRVRIRGHSAVIMEMADEQEESALQHGFKLDAVRRMADCESVSGPAKELAVRRKFLYL